MHATPLRPHEAEESIPQQQAAEELIAGGDVAAALSALERAVAEQPADGRTRGLLGLCYFKLGRLDRAAEIYGALVADNPTDPTLRVNLGLVALKSGRLDEAIANLQAAVRLAPEHRKAHNYLGLALAQRGDVAAARDAFLAAGAAAMAEKMERLLAQPAAADEARAAEAPVAAVPVPEMPAEVRVDEAAAPVHDGALQPAPIDARAGADSVEAVRQARPASTESVLAVEALAEHRALEWPRGAPFGIGAGSVSIDFPAEIHTRLEGLIAARGDTAWMPVFKRFRGKSTDRTFGAGPRQMWRASGAGRLLFSTHGGSRIFTPLSVETETYLVEDRLFAFEESFEFENGRLPGQARDLHLVRLQGAGQILLTSERPVRAERMLGEDCLSLPVSGLVGWLGALAPRLVSAEEGPAVPWVELVGEGIVLLLD